MPYVFPKDRIRPNTPMDHEEINENFQNLVGAASGALNEHNFSSDALDVSPTAAPIEPICRWHTTNVYVDPAFDCGAWAEWKVVPDIGQEPTRTSYLQLQPDLFFQTQHGIWETITGLSQTIATTGGSYWVLGSFQHDGRTKVGSVDDEGLWQAGVDASQTWTADIPAQVRPFWDHYGALYAIRVNGQIIHETITGGVHNNSITTQGSIEWGASGHLNVTITNTGEKVHNTHGIHGDTGLFPVSLDFMLELPAGSHTIDIVMQTIPHPRPANISVSNREMMILEMRQ